MKDLGKMARQMVLAYLLIKATNMREIGKITNTMAKAWSSGPMVPVSKVLTSMERKLVRAI